MSNNAIEKKTEKIEKRAPQNGQSERGVLEEVGVATSGADVVEVKPQVEPPPPPPPLSPPLPPTSVSIESFPENERAILKMFKDQISQAPAEMRRFVEGYLFEKSVESVAAPVAPATQPAESQPAQPAQSTQPATTPQDASGATVAQEVVVRRFPKRDLPAGFQRVPPLLMYSAAANGYAPVRALAIDVLQWGSRPVLVVLCKEPVNVVTASGEVVQAPPKTPFAIPAESDLGNFVRPLVEDPAGAYEIYFCPSSVVRDDSGLHVLRYDPISIGTRVPRKDIVT